MKVTLITINIIIIIIKIIIIIIIIIIIAIIIKRSGRVGSGQSREFIKARAQNRKARAGA